MPAEVAPADLVAPVEDAIVAPGLMEPPAAEAPTPPQPETFAEAVELFRRHDRPRLHSWLHDHVRVVHFEPGQIEIERAGQTPPAWHQEVGAVPVAMDGDAMAAAGGRAATARRPWPSWPRPSSRRQIEALAGDPRIKPILERFPGARIVDVRSAAPAP